MAHPRLQAVRERYAYHRGYCGVSETDVGGELTVDHFRPLSAGGDGRNDNLVYACVRCNQYKGALLPEATDAAQERRLLHPLRDNPAVHLQEDEDTGLLMGLTPAGDFHIQALRLNRPALVANRHRRRFQALSEVRLQQAVTENAALRERLARREIYIAMLEERLGQSNDPTDLS